MKPSWRFIGRSAALIACIGVPLSGCAGTVNGPSRLAGQELDAAVALYGAWSDSIELQGQRTYIWRRTLIANGVPRVCELRVQLGFRQTIRRAFLEGQPEACKLYAVKYEQVRQ